MSPPNGKIIELRQTLSYNPGQNYLRKFSPSCPLSYATKLFPKRRLCGKKTPSPNSMLLPTNAQGSGFLLNIQQHCFQGKGEREEPVQLRCLEKCFPSIQFLNSFVQDCRSQPAWSCQFFKDPSRWSTPVRIYHNSIKILWLRVLVETKK